MPKTFQISDRQIPREFTFTGLESFITKLWPTFLHTFSTEQRRLQKGLVEKGEFVFFLSYPLRPSGRTTSCLSLARSSPSSSSAEEPSCPTFKPLFSHGPLFARPSLPTKPVLWYQGMNTFFVRVYYSGVDLMF